MGKNEFNMVAFKDNKDGDDALAAICKSLKKKTHQYFILRDPLVQENNKFVLLHYGADQSAVKTRMIYASSRASLKGHLGGSVFSEDYFISTPDECSFTAFNKRRNLDLDIDLRTEAEAEREEANME